MVYNSFSDRADVPVCRKDIKMVIDFHVHAFNPKIAQRAIGQLAANCGTEPLTDGLIETTVQRMDEWGVDKAVLLSIATKPTQQRIINDWAAAQDRERFIPFMALHPQAEDWREELDHALSLGLKGLKLHPDYQHFYADDESFDEFYDALSEKGVPVLFHSGFDPVSPEKVHCSPDRALRLIKKHPQMKIILAHWGGNFMYNEVLEKLAGVGGEVYFDTAFGNACPDDMAEKIISRHGAERILFASDCPWDNAKLIKEKILRLPISDDKKELIIGKNSERLLGLV